jgi:outer membrane protein OmpA-like peptidoglycan-associated protein
MRYLIILQVVFFAITARANVVGVDAQNFNPTTSGLDFVTVHSSKTLAPGIFNFGLFFNYAANTLPYYEDAAQTKFKPVDTLLSMDLNMGIGLMNNWDIGISIPQVLNQNLDDNSTAFRGFFEDTGVNEIRLNSKYRLWDGVSQGLAVIGSVNFFLIEDFPFTGTDPGPTTNVELAYDNTINKFKWGVNLGYRFRSEGDPVPGIPVVPFGDQIIASIATSYYFSEYDFKIIGEIFGSLPSKDTTGATSTNREISTAEALIGGKWDLPYDIAAHFGVGTELFNGTASPDWRVYAGMNWTFGPMFSSNETTPASEYYMEQEEVYEETSHTYIDDQNAFKEPPKNEETFLAKNILFEFNGSAVRKDFHQYLQKLADYVMKDGGFTELVVIGHTDSVGSDSYNMELSIKRAASVKEVVASFLPEDQRSKVRFEGEGERSPIASNANYQGRALNRRVEFFIKRRP